MQLDIIPTGAALARNARAAFPFVVVPGREVMTALAQLRHEHHGSSPIVWGDEESAGILFELLDEDVARSPLDSLRLSLAGSGTELLARRQAETHARAQEFLRKAGIDPATETAGDGTDAATLLASSWPKDALPHTKLLGILDHKTNAPKPEVLIGLLPTPNSYETAAFLNFGNWNDCPPPEIHVALAREWHQRYGARVVVITHEVVEFEVERPISTRLEAAEMAILHHSYCSDIVDQGVGSLEALAAVLLDARYWYFWWD